MQQKCDCLMQYGSGMMVSTMVKSVCAHISPFTLALQTRFKAVSNQFTAAGNAPNALWKPRMWFGKVI